MDDPGTALVTGGSSGIGAALAEEFARNGHDLVLVARREDRLTRLGGELSEDYDVHATVVVRDLDQDGAAQDLYDTLDERDVRVDVLVNNVGVGTYGPFQYADLDRERTQLRLNVQTTMELTRLYLDDFTERDDGTILNVGSTAGFQPGPKMAGYYASKAYVNSFTQAIAEELRGTGVSATVLCPGPVDTEFQSRAGMSHSKLGSNSASTPEAVAKAGYSGAMKGKPVVIPGLSMKALYLLGKVSPAFLQRRLASWVNGDR
jgi:short-subunit dehydrogenase